MTGQMMTGNSDLASTATSSTSDLSAVQQCTYSSICNSWIHNKTVYGPNDAYKASIPVFADTQESVSLVLQGQPLVAAGGVVMRMSVSASDHQYYIDFPTITGKNKIGEKYVMSF